MKTYCYNCGALAEFSIKAKPKFCSKCGVSFSGKSEGPKQNMPMSEEAEEEDIVNIPDIDELDFEIYEMRNNKETVGSLVGTSTSQPSSNKPPKNTPSMTREQAMETFRKEAGSIRQTNKKKDAET